MRSKGKNFSIAEEMQLCRSSLHVGKGPAIGTNQFMLTFWEHVAAHFNNNRPDSSEERPFRSVESKWALIQHDVNKFCGAIANVPQLSLSGASVDDEVERAMELFQKTHRTRGIKDNKAFKFLHCWRLLSCEPKWAAMHQRDEGTKRSSSACNADEQSTDQVELGNRQLGVKAAKAMKDATQQEQRKHRHFEEVAKAATRLAAASELRADEVKRANRLVLFAIAFDGLDKVSRAYLRSQRELALKEMANGS